MFTSWAQSQPRDVLPSTLVNVFGLFISLNDASGNVCFAPPFCTSLICFHRYMQFLRTFSVPPVVLSPQMFHVRRLVQRSVGEMDTFREKPGAGLRAANRPFLPSVTMPSAEQTRSSCRPHCQGSALLAPPMSHSFE